NGTMRTRIRSCCKSRLRRACASSAFSVSSTALARFPCTVETSLTLSAISRVTSWKRVNRSNSSGSNSRMDSFANSRRDCICDSAWISISRSCARNRATLSVSSCIAALRERISPSIRLRAMATSPASLTSRSTMSARTRNSAFGCNSRSASGTTFAAPTGARVEPPLAALERNVQIEFIQRTVAFLGFGELLGHTALRFAGRRGLRRRFPFLGRRRFLRDARLLPDALQPRDQLRDGSRHTQFDYARNHCLDRVDRLSDQRLFVLGKLAG